MKPHIRTAAIVLGALFFAACVKLPDTVFESFPFARKIFWVGHHKTLVRRTIPGKRLVVGKTRPCQWPQDPADKHPRQHGLLPHEPVQAAPQRYRNHGNAWGIP